MNKILIVHTSWYEEHISKMINISEGILEQKFECRKAKAPGAIELAALAKNKISKDKYIACLLYTSPSPRDRTRSRMPSSA